VAQSNVALDRDSSRPVIREDLGVVGTVTQSKLVLQVAATLDIGAAAMSPRAK